MFSRPSGYLCSLGACLALTGPAAAADCGALVADFNSAVADKSFEKVKVAMAAIADDSACNFDIDAYRTQEIDSIIDIAGAAPIESEREQMIEFAQEIIKIGGTWRSREKLGDYCARRGQYRDALAWYDSAIYYISQAAPPATPEERKELDQRVEELRKGAPD
jgi:hypothetical protein